MTNPLVPQSSTMTYTFSFSPGKSEINAVLMTSFPVRYFDFYSVGLKGCETIIGIGFPPLDGQQIHFKQRQWMKIRLSNAVCEKGFDRPLVQQARRCPVVDRRNDWTGRFVQFQFRRKLFLIDEHD